MSAFTMVSGFKFIFKFKSKSEFEGAGAELDSGSIITGQKSSCTSRPKVTYKIHENIQENIKIKEK